MHFSYLVCLFLPGILFSSPGNAAPRKDRGVPNLLDALDYARKQKCNAPMYMNAADSDPQTQWEQSGAQDLWDALVWEYRSTAHRKYPSLPHYVAEALGNTSPNFDCGNGQGHGKNDCLDFEGKCDQDVGPAGFLILNSLSSVSKFYAPFYEKLALAEGKDLTSVDDLATKFVKYNKPRMSAEEIIGFVADFLALGAGQLVSRGMESGIAPLARPAGKGGKPPSYEASEASKWYEAKLNDYKLLTNQMAFEVTIVAEQYIEAGKNLFESAQSIIQESESFKHLMDSVSNQWANSVDSYMGKLFNGTLSSDSEVSDGISDFATLSGMLTDGKFSRAVDPGDIVSHAEQLMYSQLIPIALHQNDKMRPTLIVRPYACDDDDRIKQDTLFTEMFYQPSTDEWKDTAFTIDKYPKLCFFFVDADKDGAGLLIHTGERKQRLSVLNGMQHSVLNGDSSSMAGLTLQDFAQSIHEDWLKNKNKNHQSYKIDRNAKSGDPNNLFENPITAPGLYSMFFNECGSDDPKSDLKKSTDMDIVATNIDDAHDWNFANMKLGYPCRPVKLPYGKH